MCQCADLLSAMHNGRGGESFIILLESNPCCLTHCALNIKARQDIPEILTSSLVSFYGITHKLELKFFLFAQFLLNSHFEQLMNLRNLKTENLKFRTDLGDQVMSGLSETL